MPPLNLLDRLQRIAAKSPAAVRFAVALRNQCRCVIKYHLAESPDALDTGERWLVQRVASYGDRFVDVGANVGDWLGMVRESLTGRPFAALAFEPSVSAFEELQRRYGADSGIVLSNIALGSEAGSLAFFEEPDAGRGSTLVAEFMRTRGTTRTVTVATLDAALRDAGWSRVDLLKIDAEGYDLQVMRGARESIASRSIGVIQFEYNRAWQLVGDTLRAAYMLLESSGYRVFVLKRDGLYTLDYLRYEEYFEYTNFVAIAPQQIGAFEDRQRGVI
ncbi:MAG: FkbM family methyltransferase [Candidatus Aquilonibacter sp.]